MPDGLVEGHSCSLLLCSKRVVCACFLVLLQSQLAVLVSKCKGPEDLDYFLLEAAALVGLSTPPEGGAKVRHVVEAFASAALILLGLSNKSCCTGGRVLL